LCKPATGRSCSGLFATGADSLQTQLGQDTPMTLPTTRNAATDRTHEEALDAFLGKRAEIYEMLEGLQGLSADHFLADPDEVTWGEVGTLAH
jgi:hypothetical protein